MLFFFLFLFIGSVHAQQFEKILIGPHVNDGGDSRAVNWVDFDNDGDLDLFVTNGLSTGENNFFYINNGNGTFTKNDTSVITKDLSPSDGASWGDMDNDGDLDMAMVTWYGKRNYLYRNEGNGVFTFLSASPVSTDLTYSETCSWGDFDNDGKLDLYITNSAGSLANILYKNAGNSSFSKVTGLFMADAFHSRNIDWIDLNNDKLTDIFITNEEGENENVYFNNGSGSFIKSTISGLTNNSGATAGSSWADVDNDGDFDVVLINYNNERNHLLINNGNGTFTKSSSAPFTTDIANSFGSAFADIDNDGDVDLFIANAFTGSARTANFLYLNNGDGTFTKDTGIVAKETGWSYGAAFADYNKDGWQDLFIAKCYQKTENNTLYKNTGGTNKWIIVDLEGRISNRTAIGAIIKIKTVVNGISKWQMRRVAGQEGYCGQNLQVHFGLGAAASVDSMVVLWPSGNKTVKTGVASGVFYKIIEDSSLSTGLRTDTRDGSKLNAVALFPNPADDKTSLRFSLSESSTVSVVVYNTLGEVVYRYTEQGEHSGTYTLELALANLAPGVYYCSLLAGGITTTKKLLIQR